MASRLVSLTGLRRGTATSMQRVSTYSPAAAAARMGSMNARREMHSSSVRLAEKESTKHKKGLYTDPEIIPLYAIVILAVSGGLYMASKHLFTDNDLRRAREYPTDEHGDYIDKPQRRPEWEPTKKKE